MKKNNSGFSLVELVVIMALMAIFMGIFSLGIGQLTGYDAKETYKKISSAITKNKIDTLGKAKAPGSMYLEIYKSDSDNQIYARTVIVDTDTKTETKIDETKLSKRGRSTVTYEMEGGSGVEATESHPLKICFNRSTGAIVDLADPGTVSTLKYIRVTAGTKTYTIELVPSTGKIIGK